MDGLSAEQRHFFDVNGYLLLEGVLPEKTWALLTGDVFVPLDVTKTFHPFSETPGAPARPPV